MVGPERFSFLGQEGDLHSGWFPKEQELLWLFNLHYFEFLSEIESPTEAAGLILKWIAEVPPAHPTAWHPYPLSHRIAAWARSYGRIAEVLSEREKQTLIDSLWNQLHYLKNHLEFDLLGNHLLVNAKGLIVGGAFLNQKSFADRGLGILRTHLPRQILADGGHYERSPMYHALLLLDLITCCDALTTRGWEGSDLLRDTIGAMGRYLSQIAIGESLPLLNDSSEENIPPLTLLQQEVERINPGSWISEPGSGYLEPTGLLVHRCDDSVLIADGGPLSADEQPGHAHSDTLGFLWWVNGTPFITDSGTFTYRESPERAYFRSAAAHNVVRLREIEPDELWREFRVGHRGYPTDVTWDGDQQILSGGHTSYHHLGVQIHRRFLCRGLPHELLVEDTLTSSSDHSHPFEGRLHFAPGVTIQRSGERSLLCSRGDLAVQLDITGDLSELSVIETPYSNRFNSKVWRAALSYSGLLRGRSAAMMSLRFTRS